MKSKRFELALDRIQPTQWKRFEDFASEFLAAEFPNLRTVASASGDRARDAELFSPENDPLILLQYSVSSDWAAKIRSTAERISSEFPDASVLVYVTSQIIGAKADKLKKEVRGKSDLFLDIRDATWFVERRHSSMQREIAAESLATDIVDPYLASQEIVSDKTTALTSLENQAAFVYLALQWEDDSREKGLTRLCFEGLVRAVLRDTDSENRAVRSEIQRHIRLVLPNHPPEKVDTYTDAALTRLTKRFIRHYRATDEFCLMHDERLRLRERVASYEGVFVEFRTELAALTIKSSPTTS
jgi:hypothetical protein